MHLGHTSVMGLGFIFFLLTNVLEKCLDLCVHMGWQIPLVPVLTLVMAELAAAAAPNAHTVHCNITQHLHQSISNPALLRDLRILTELMDAVQSPRNFLFLFRRSGYPRTSKWHSMPALQTTKSFLGSLGTCFCQ